MKRIAMNFLVCLVGCYIFAWIAAALSLNVLFAIPLILSIFISLYMEQAEKVEELEDRIKRLEQGEYLPEVKERTELS